MPKVTGASCDVPFWPALSCVCVCVCVCVGGGGGGGGHACIQVNACNVSEKEVTWIKWSIGSIA